MANDFRNVVIMSYPVAWDCGPVRGKRWSCDYESDSTCCADTTLIPRPLAPASRRTALFYLVTAREVLLFCSPRPGSGRGAGGEGQDRATALLRWAAGFSLPIGRQDLEVVHTSSHRMIAAPDNLVLRGNFDHRNPSRSRMGSNHSISIG